MVKDFTISQTHLISDKHKKKAESLMKPKRELPRYKTYQAKCKCKKWTACEFRLYDLETKARAHADECNRRVVIGEFPPNICYSDQIFHFKVIYPKSERQKPKKYQEVLTIIQTA